MEHFLEIQNKVNNLKRFKPKTQKKLIEKYAKEMNIPKEYFEAITNGNIESLLQELEILKNTDEGKQLNLKGNLLDNLKTLKQNIDSDDENIDDDPITVKINMLKNGDLKSNINKYIKDNNLFSKTEKMVINLDPVLKELLSLDVNKIYLVDLVNLLK